MIFARGLGVPQFTDHPTASAYLRRIASEPENRLLMRRVVAPTVAAAASDEDVIRELAWRLVRGELHVVVMTQPGARTGTAGTATASGASSTTSTAAAEEAKDEAPPQTTGDTAPIREQEPDPEEASVLPEDCDEKAQAETMEAASEAGTPLCEV
jgi:hypothetical protein